MVQQYSWAVFECVCVCVCVCMCVCVFTPNCSEVTELMTGRKELVPASVHLAAK